MILMALLPHSFRQQYPITRAIIIDGTKNTKSDSGATLVS